MPEPCNQNFFDSMKFRPPKIAHVIKPLVYGFEALINASFRTAESCIHVSDEEARHRGVEQHRKPNRQVKLFVRHAWCLRPHYPTGSSIY